MTDLIKVRVQLPRDSDPNLGPGWTTLWCREGTSDEAVIDEVWIADVYHARGLDVLNYDVVENVLNGRKQPRVIDIGACTGAFSALVARMYPGCEVLAVEPDAENFALLQKNVATFGGRVATLRAAVGHAFGHLSLIGGEGTGHTVHDGSGQVVDMVPLDHLIGDGAAFLKIDAEAAEFSMIEACPSAALARVNLIHMEVHGPGTCPWVTDIDRKYGDLMTKLAKTHAVTVFGRPDLGGMLYAHAYPS